MQTMKRALLPHVLALCGLLAACGGGDTPAGSNNIGGSGGGTGSLDTDQVFRRLNPSIGLTVKPSASFNFYVGYGEGSRAPTSTELGCADPTTPCKLPNAMAGDPPLKAVVAFAPGRGGVQQRADGNFEPLRHC